MADAEFLIAENGVLRDPIHRACRAAVTYPVAGRGRARSLEDVQQLYDRVQRKWRIRLTKLRQVGWNFFENSNNPDKHFTFVRNCPPVGISTTNPISYATCKRSKICPNCYARQIIIPACMAFEVLLPSLSQERRSQMSLIAFQRVMRRDTTQLPLESAISDLKKPRNQIIEMDSIRPQPIGGIVFCNLSLNDDGDHWVYRRSGVAIVDSPNADIDIPGRAADHSVRHVSKLNLDNACAAIGWAAKYPKTWLHAPLDPSVEMLNAMEDARFRQIRFHGVLRNGPLRRMKQQEIAAKRHTQIQN